MWYNLLADLLICQTFFHQIVVTSQFAKLSLRQTFLLYGTFKNGNYAYAYKGHLENKTTIESIDVW